MICLAFFLQHWNENLHSCYNHFMSDYYVSETVALFRQLTIFQGLDDAQLAEIENRFTRIKVHRGEILIEEGSPGDYFYIVLKGQLAVTQNTLEGVVQIATLGRGDYFGEEALLFGQPRSASITTLEDCEILRLDYEGFQQLIEMYPRLRLNFTATAESREIAEKEDFDWLGKDEVIYLIRRKHVIFLALSLILPILLALMGIPLAVWGMFIESPALHLMFSILGGVILAAGVLWGVWNWLDWGNDYYIITNQRVIWLENVIGIYSSRREAPLTTILTVNKITTQFGRIFNYGNIDVRTYTGSIVMRNMSDPDLFEAFLRGHRERAQHRNQEQERQKIRQALETRFKMDEAGMLPTKPAPPPAKPPPKRDGVSLKEVLDTFLKMRYEKQGVITYRKHWLVLAGKIWKPSLAQLVLLGFAIFLIYKMGIRHEEFLLTGLSWGVLLFLGFVMISLWWGYHYLDWSNDIYQLTPEQILDIEKKPLGKEDKKTASLDSILSIEHDRKGIIQLLFNYGTVVINVGQTQFTFNGVLNPDQVHQDIGAYIEARARKKREKEIHEESARMSDWFSIYREHERRRSEKS